MQFKDYYQTLGVPRTATEDEIRKSYRRLARKYHPDVSKETDAEARMKEVNEAYAVLSDPERRAAYDSLGQNRQAGQDFRPPPDWGTGFEFSGAGSASGEAADFSEFFAQMFGRAGRPTGRRTAHGFDGRGEDHHARIVIDLDDAWAGSTRQISLRMPQLAADGQVSLAERTLNVKIPAGVREGQMIRLAGQGGPGLGGGAAGDLYLEVHFNPHARFRVNGRDVRLDLPLTPWEAALGATIAIPLPAGQKVNVRIPPGAQSGREMKVSGKGIPGKPAGDLYLNLQIMAPAAESERARALYETMARELPFNPRADWGNDNSGDRGTSRTNETGGTKRSAS